MTDQDAMKLALDALETEVSIDWTNNDEFNASAEKMHEAITALKARLAQPKQEPVALPCCGYADASAVKWNPFNRIVQCHSCGQTYAPPQRTWVGSGDLEDSSDYLVSTQRTEQNFCSRCGKRTPDLITIHTCTPPKENT
jgi:hypothetical protein